ncbi:hypothetical protein [Montanilutibacter psychrotolerans]|uniref:hypothetical protein n=1 Tax=Montanilutibacter psychrotolerans TaxID=1327343 RepID=UPI0011CD3AB8|nr:hypothetical protein [Lysobacter psychrotolerans]
MLLNVLKRAAVLFLTVAGVSTAAVAALAWYHVRIACPANFVCYLRMQPTGDWLAPFAVAAVGFAVCLLVSLLSVKLGRSPK